MQVIKAIGQGGFGNVDLVQDASGVQFARKTFSRNQPLDDSLLENVLKRFAKEVRVQGSISHRNIVPILSSDLSVYPPSYLMPVAAGNLADDIDFDRTLGGNFIAALSDIVAGLDELHSMQIYHRDLKPANVLRFPSEHGSLYAISDFGLISLRESRLSVLTRTGMRKGSDYYTAPEITKDLKSASVQSDIYSLGCILHDMVGTEERVPCGEIREAGDFSPILLGCTRRDPTQRFKSAKAVLDAILSIEFAPSTGSSQESIDFIAMLDAPTPAPPESWERLADFVESSNNSGDLLAILGRLQVDRIEHLCSNAPAAASRIGLVFADWIRRTAFNFDYCDALANRLDAFFQLHDFETKVECLLALLALGTSHNRWYVERKFMQLCGSEMDDNLAKRVAIHFRIAETDVCRMVDHLESSIKVSRSELHPALVKALGDICP
ncbi:serine/threonine protein kinase [Sinorhizobium meliloti]|uniref:serine/threonine protein kinase n=1 Tax=Rhizobium meliloti TaxID=382 RepID=UPI000FDAD760|nr:protein kinase [Sinorhizobium meliloti]RVH00097.1 hypothetical protein CN210_28655 [Sinorhizobium meliloti]